MSEAVPRLAKIKLNPRREKTTLHFHLAFRPSQHHRENVEFELMAGDAMTLLSALQSVQKTNRWRVPQFLPKGQRGRPQLRIVRNDDD